MKEAHTQRDQSCVSLQWLMARLINIAYCHGSNQALMAKAGRDLGFMLSMVCQTSTGTRVAVNTRLTLYQTSCQTVKLSSVM